MMGGGGGYGGNMAGNGGGMNQGMRGMNQGGMNQPWSGPMGNPQGPQMRQLPLHVNINQLQNMIDRLMATLKSST